jgi:uncharacterized membrane protein
MGVDRIAFFSDAVMAIAITLLVIELKLPEQEGEASIWHQLGEMHPKLLGYFLSFGVIALFWETHHRMFTLLQRYDRGLIWLNVLFLMFLGLLPFSTSVFGLWRAFGRSPGPIAL